MNEIEKKLHEDVMKSILSNVKDLPMPLKGGTALYLAYQLNRFSVDLDFNSIKKFNLESRIKKACGQVGITDVNIRKRKDTQTVDRYLIDYKKGDVKGLLKVEISHREKEVESQIINGIRVVPIEKIIEDKVKLVTDSDSRKKARDLNDVGFLLENHADKFTPQQLQDLGNALNNKESLISGFVVDWEDDNLLSHRTIEEVVDKIESNLKRNKSEKIIQEPEVKPTVINNNKDEIEQNENLSKGEEQTLKTEQLAAADVPIEQIFNARFDDLVNAKSQQVENLVNKIEKAIENQESKLNSLGKEPVGIFAKKQNQAWHKKSDKIQSRINQQSKRLSQVKHIASDVQGSKIKELALEKLKRQDIDLYRKWQTHNRQALEKKKQEYRQSQEESKKAKRTVSNSLKLTH